MVVAFEAGGEVYSTEHPPEESEHCGGSKDPELDPKTTVPVGRTWAAEAAAPTCTAQVEFESEKTEVGSQARATETDPGWVEVEVVEVTWEVEEEVLAETVEVKDEVVWLEVVVVYGAVEVVRGADVVERTVVMALVEVTMEVADVDELVWPRVWVPVPV